MFQGCHEQEEIEAIGSSLVPNSKREWKDKSGHARQIKDKAKTNNGQKWQMRKFVQYSYSLSWLISSLPSLVLYDGKAVVIVYKRLMENIQT